MALKFPQTNKSSIDGKNFVKLKDGESTHLILRGEVFVFRQHWKGNRTTPCTDNKETCADCQAGVKSTFRFRVNAITKEGDKNIVKVWEQSWTVYQNIEELSREMDLEITPIKVVRRGSTMNDTSYTLIPSVALSKEQQERLSDMKLFDLPLLDKELQGLSDSKPGDFSAENVPF
jgi:hypothetical protein